VTTEPAAPAVPAEPPAASAAAPRRRWPAGDIVLVSVAGLLALLLILIAAITLLVGTSNAQAAAARLGTRVVGVDLVPGDCLQDFTQVAGPTFDFELVDCKAPHAAELVLYDQQSNLENYLGPRAMSELAQTLCDTTLRYGLSVADLSKYPNAYLFGVFQGRAEW
jgi:hypothetical protein